mgnify:CR=1 FL=1|jgi:hypothetical protein
MTHALGRFLIRETTISAGSTAEVFYRVFTAGEKAISLSNLQYYGGDSGENLQLFLIPANVMAAGLKPSDAPGSIALTHNGQMNGAKGTVEFPSTVVGEPMAFRWPMTVIPPFCSIAANMDASNAAAWVVTIGGFEINA